LIDLNDFLKIPSKCATVKQRKDCDGLTVLNQLQFTRM